MHSERHPAGKACDLRHACMAEGRCKHKALCRCCMACCILKFACVRARGMPSQKCRECVGGCKHTQAASLHKRSHAQLAAPDQLRQLHPEPVHREAHHVKEAALDAAHKAARKALDACTSGGGGVG